MLDHRVHRGQEDDPKRLGWGLGGAFCRPDCRQHSLHPGGNTSQRCRRGGQTAEEKKVDWDFATEWSLPKLESLRVIIPGIFGYRMEEFSTRRIPLSPPGEKWGAGRKDSCRGCGQILRLLGQGRGRPARRSAELESSDPEVRAAAVANLGADRAEIVEVMRGDNLDMRTANRGLGQVPKPQRRHSGNGEYAGVLVALFAIFALLNSWRGKASPYTRWSAAWSGFGERPRCSP